MIPRPLLAALVAATLAGCGAAPTEMSAQEEQGFKGGGAGGRSDAAKAGLADFQKRWQAQHGATNAPPAAANAAPKGG